MTGSAARRVGKAAPRLDIRPLVAEVADAIVNGRDDPWIQWTADRRAVRVNLAQILPPAKNQTMEGRRKRFYAALDATVAGAGFNREGAWYREGDAAA